MTSTSKNNSIFQLIRVRKDYGKLIQTICKCCDPKVIYGLFVGELEKACKSA
jgi:hypothetical protein